MEFDAPGLFGNTYFGVRLTCVGLFDGGLFGGLFG